MIKMWKNSTINVNIVKHEPQFGLFMAMDEKLKKTVICPSKI